MILMAHLNGSNTNKSVQNIVKDILIFPRYYILDVYAMWCENFVTPIYGITEDWNVHQLRTHGVPLGTHS